MSKLSVIHWLPRLLAVTFILFISMFALDVFTEYETFSQIALALVMHLLPTFLLIIVTWVAWRYSLFGGFLFILLGLFSVIFFRTYADFISFLLVSMPPLLVGILFIWDAQAQSRQKLHDEAPVFVQNH